MSKFLIEYNKPNNSLDNFQRNMGLIMVNFDYNSKKLASLLDISTGTFSNYLSFGSNNRKRSPKIETLLPLENTFSISAIRFKVELLTISDFNYYIEKNNIKLKSPLDELDEATRNIYKRFENQMAAYGALTDLNENEKTPINSKLDVAYFEDINKVGLITNWFNQGGYTLLPKRAFRVPVDFAIKFIGDEMNNEQHKFNIQSGATLGFREIGNLKNPIINDIYLVATRDKPPMVKVLKSINAKMETIELVNLNTKEFPEIFSYNFEDNPSFYELVTIIPPPIVKH